MIKRSPCWSGNFSGFRLEITRHRVKAPTCTENVLDFTYMYSFSPSKRATDSYHITISIHANLFLSEKTHTHARTNTHVDTHSHTLARTRTHTHTTTCIHAFAVPYIRVTMRSLLQYPLQCILMKAQYVKLCFCYKAMDVRNAVICYFLHRSHCHLPQKGSLVIHESFSSYPWHLLKEKT